MEHLTALIRLVSEGGWRLGVPLAISGILTIIAHRFGFPEPAALTSYLGWATVAAIAGTAFTAVSIIAGIGRHIRGVRHSSALALHEEAELKANFSSLSPRECEVLLGILESGAKRVKIHILSEAHPLVEKGIFYRLDHNRVEPMCEVPKLLRDRRDEIIADYQRSRSFNA